MEPGDGIKKILWSVDPCDTALRPMGAARQMIRVLAQQTGARVQPVYIAASLPVIGPSTIIDSEYKEHVARARSVFRKLVENSRIPQVMPPEILSIPVSRTRDAISILCEYAQKEEADIIVVSTHGRRGLRRLMLGSFAESLILMSQLPVLLVNPQARPRREYARILFPTDLGPYAEQCLEQALILAESLRARIIVLHSAPVPRGSDIGSEITSFGELRQSLSGPWKDEYERRAEKLDSYVERARQKGVVAESYLDISGMDLLAVIWDSIEKLNIDLVAMPGQSGPYEGIFTGSTTRQVARTSPCPVWILHRRSASI